MHRFSTPERPHEIHLLAISLAAVGSTPRPVGGFHPGKRRPQAPLFAPRTRGSTVSLHRYRLARPGLETSIGRKSFASLRHDPDRPHWRQRGWWHWVVVNLPADATQPGPAGKADGSGSAGRRPDQYRFLAPGLGPPACRWATSPTATNFTPALVRETSPAPPPPWLVKHD